MTEEKMQALAQRIVGEIQSEIDKLIEERDAIVSAVVGTIGGTVEGRPTNRINYLQRLRELVRIEQGVAVYDVLKTYEKGEKDGR